MIVLWYFFSRLCLLFYVVFLVVSGDFEENVAKTSRVAMSQLLE